MSIENIRAQAVYDAIESCDTITRCDTADDAISMIADITAEEVVGVVRGEQLINEVTDQLYDTYKFESPPALTEAYVTDEQPLQHSVEQITFATHDLFDTCTNAAATKSLITTRVCNERSVPSTEAVEELVDELLRTNYSFEE